MALEIKMRTNTDGKAKCDICGNGQKRSLMMFDLALGKAIFTLCDVCNEKVFDKALKATCAVNHKLKSAEDIKLINSRKSAVRGEDEWGTLPSKASGEK